MMKIEKNIPIPHRRKYPFSDMEVGDSIEIDSAEAKSARATASQHGKKHGVKFTSRTADGKMRIWRVE